MNPEKWKEMEFWLFPNMYYFLSWPEKVQLIKILSLLNFVLYSSQCCRELSFSLRVMAAPLTKVMP